MEAGRCQQSARDMNANALAQQHLLEGAAQGRDEEEFERRLLLGGNRLPWASRRPYLYPLLLTMRSSRLVGMLRLAFAACLGILVIYLNAPVPVMAIGVAASLVGIAMNLRALCPRKTWHDPSIVNVNRQPPHAPCCWYPSFQEAIARNRAACPNVLTLNGQWRFLLAEDVDRAPIFHGPDFDDSSWSDITVPAHWQLEDCGRKDLPIYTNTNYPFPNCPPYVLCKNPTGCYRRSFELPQDWCQKVLSGAGRVCLLLQGVDSALTVWIDGNEVGYAQGSREPCEFDITSMLSSSRTHLLAVRVLRWCDGSYLEDQDHWWLSGIYRDVELILRPGQVRIVDYSVVAQLTPESSYTDGTLDVHVFLRGGGQPHALSSCRVICDLVDTTSGDSRLPLIPVDQHRISGAPEQVVHIFKLSVSDVRPWSAEDPNLYTVVMGVEGEQYESCRVGFRTVGVKNGQILVNGQPVMFCGVNRHEHDAWSGKVITEESMRLDILLMKQYNFNAVRNSHYPNHWLWYTLTDELGLYVVDEANIETHGQVPMCRLSDDPLWQKAYLDRVQRMYLSNRNHASIVMWSLGNESGDGRNLAACRRWLRERKDSRPIMYEGGGAVFEGTGCTNLTDVVCPMYPTPMRVEQLGTSVLGETRPVVLCEYSHAMGNSNGNLFKYFDLFRKLRRLQGGFIWDWVDQGLEVSHPGTGELHFGYGGSFGDIHCEGYERFCTNGLLFPDRKPHPALFEAKHLMAPVSFAFTTESGRRVRVENRFSFLSLSHLSFSWSLTCDLLPGEIAHGDMEVPHIPAGAAIELQGDWELSLDKISSHSDLLVRSAKNFFLNVTASLTSDTPWASRGHIVAHEQLEFSMQSNEDEPPLTDIELLPPLLVSDSRQREEADWTEADLENALLEQEDLTEETTGAGAVASQMVSSGTVCVTGEGLDLCISCTDGRIVHFRSQGRDVLEPGEGPEHCMWRAATDNDYAGFDTMLHFVAGSWVAHSVGSLLPLKMRSYHSRWKARGLTASSPHGEKVISMHVTQPFASMATIIVRHAILGDRDEQLFRTKTEYQCFGNGDVCMRCEVEPCFRKLDCLSLARVGLHLRAPAGADMVTWLGRGPHECYPDRKSAAVVAVHQGKIEDQHVPYMHPCENGGKADVKWVAITEGAGGCGLLLLAGDPSPAQSMNVSLWSVSELEEAKYALDLPERDPQSTPAHIHFDHAFMGVGGDNTWLPSLVHQEYTLDSQRRYSYEVWMRPISAGQQPHKAAQGLGRLRVPAMTSPESRARLQDAISRSSSRANMAEEAFMVNQAAPGRAAGLGRRHSPPRLRGSVSLGRMPENSEVL